MKKVVCFLMFFLSVYTFGQTELSYEMSDITGSDSGYCINNFKTKNPVVLSFDFTDLVGDTTELTLYAADKSGTQYIPAEFESGYAVLNKSNYQIIFNEDTINVIHFYKKDWFDDAFCFKVAKQDSGTLTLRIKK